MSSIDLRDASVAEEDFRYPPARAVVMGVCPNSDRVTPVFGGTGSMSASRMESIMWDWPAHATGANAWWTKSAFTSGGPSRVAEILEQTGCTVVVALGLEVRRELDVPDGPLYSWGITEHRGRQVHVLRFPHPSGLNRHWNKPENKALARVALIDALTRR